MATVAIARPGPDEYAHFYNTYVSIVPAGEVTEILAGQMKGLLALLSEIGEAGADYRYAPDKWSVKQAVGHVIDAERVFTYRALCFSRADAGPLRSFDQNLYVNNGPSEHASLAQLAEEFEAVRQATVCLFRGLRSEDWDKAGIASDHRITVRALAYVTAGHELHHSRILAERYLPGFRAAQ
jgi:hypothetical protein